MDSTRCDTGRWRSRQEATDKGIQAERESRRHELPVQVPPHLSLFPRSSALQDADPASAACTYQLSQAARTPQLSTADQALLWLDSRMMSPCSILGSKLEG